MRPNCFDGRQPQSRPPGTAGFQPARCAPEARGPRGPPKPACIARAGGGQGARSGGLAWARFHRRRRRHGERARGRVRRDRPADRQRRAGRSPSFARPARSSSIPRADIWAATCAAVREATAGLAPGDVAGLGFDATCSLVALDAAGGSLTVSPTGRRRARHASSGWTIAPSRRRREINAGGHDAAALRRRRHLAGDGAAEADVARPPCPARPSRRAHFFDLTDFLTFKRQRLDGALDLHRRLQMALPGPRAPLAGGDLFARIGLGGCSTTARAASAPRSSRRARRSARGLDADAAAAMGLAPGVPVAAGLIDAHAGALGTIGGALGGEPADPRRRLALILGTSSCCMALRRRGALHPRRLGAAL